MLDTSSRRLCGFHNSYSPGTLQFNDPVKAKTLSCSQAGFNRTHNSLGPEVDNHSDSAQLAQSAG